MEPLLIQKPMILESIIPSQKIMSHSVEFFTQSTLAMLRPTTTLGGQEYCIKPTRFKVLSEGLGFKFGDPRKLIVVAHSMGGMAARSYIADQRTEAVQEIQQLITYGTPHWGSLFTSEVQTISRGARDFGF